MAAAAWRGLLLRDVQLPDSNISKVNGQAEKPPFLGRMVLVECDGVRHVANQDRTGKWRTLSKRKELQGVVEIIRVVQ